MADDIVITVDPREVRIKPGEQLSVLVTVRNRSEATGNYRLAVEGEIADWAKLESEDLAAFGGEEARTRLVLKAPADAHTTLHHISIRVSSQHQSEVEALGRLDVEVTGAPLPQPLEQLRSKRSQEVIWKGIEVSAAPAKGGELPPGTGQWRIDVRNATAFVYTYGFAVSGINPAALSVDPPLLVLMPGEQGVALLTVQLPPDSAAKTHRFELRVYSHANILERTELPLKLELKPAGQAAPLADTASEQAAPDNPDAPLIVKSGGAAQFQVAADRRRFNLAGGTQQLVNLEIHNHSGSPLALEIRCEGLPDAWVSLTSQLLNIAPRKSGGAVLTLSPPADVPPGSYPLCVLVQLRRHPDPGPRLNLLASVGEQAAARDVPAMNVAIDPRSLTVPPGASVDAKVTVRSLVDSLDTVEVEVLVDGSTRPWVNIDWRKQTIFQVGAAAGVAETQIHIEPPEDPAEATAGTYPLAIRSWFSNSADTKAQTEAELEIQLVGDYSIGLETAEARGVQSQSYQLACSNNANAQLELRLTGSDASGTLDYKFDPLVLKVPPEQTEQAILTVRAKQTTEQERRTAFRVSGQGEYLLHGGARVMASNYETNGAFVQTPPPALSLLLDPPDAETTTKAHQFQARVRNPSSTTLRVQVAVTADRGSLVFQVDPAEFELGPNKDTQVTLIAQAKDRPKPGKRRELNFRVTASSSNNEVRAASTAGSLVQINNEPKRRIRWRIPALVALLAMLGLPFTVPGLMSTVINWLRRQPPPAIVVPTTAPAPIPPTQAPSIAAQLPSPPPLPSVAPVLPLEVSVSASNAASDFNDCAQNPTTYVASNIVDGKEDTAWRVAGNGVGEWVLLQFNQPVRIEEIQIMPGYAKTDPDCPGGAVDRFTQNRRVSEARFDFDGSSVTAQFADQRVMQPFKLAAPVTTTSIRISILSSTDHNGRDAVAISEVVVVGRPEGQQ